jgi:hypothetical protein
MGRVGHSRKRRVSVQIERDEAAVGTGPPKGDGAPDAVAGLGGELVGNLVGNGRLVGNGFLVGSGLLAGTSAVASGPGEHAGQEKNNGECPSWRP